MAGTVTALILGAAGCGGSIETRMVDGAGGPRGQARIRCYYVKNTGERTIVITLRTHHREAGKTREHASDKNWELLPGEEKLLGRYDPNACEERYEILATRAK